MWDDYYIQLFFVLKYVITENFNDLSAISWTLNVYIIGWIQEREIESFLI